MTERRSEIDSLFQRMAARSAPTASTEAAAPAAVSHASMPAPATPAQAAKTAEEWPLFAMLKTPRRAWHPPHMMMAVEDVPPRAEPRPEPAVVPPPTVTDEDGPTRHMSPLELLFRRAEESGQAQNVGSVFAPAPQAVAERQPQARMAPPPLKTRAKPLAPLTPAPSAEVPTTTQPRQRDWQPLDGVPSHLFERVGAR